MVFTERTYATSIPFEAVLAEVETFITRTHPKPLKLCRQNACELWVGLSAVDNPTAVLVSTFEGGLKVSYGRIGVARTMLSGSALVTAIVSVGLSVAVHGVTAAATKASESMFWSFIENKIVELGQKYPGKQITQDAMASSHNQRGAEVGTPRLDPISALEGLARLKEQGAITQEEFDLKKQELLKRIC